MVVFSQKVSRQQEQLEEEERSTNVYSTESFKSTIKAKTNSTITIAATFTQKKEHSSNFLSQRRPQNVLFVPPPKHHQSRQN